MIIKKEYHFYAAHRNKAAGAKCGRIHGHTYKVSCFFRFSEIGPGGVCFLFSDIDALVEPLIKSYCHWFLLWEKDPLVDILTNANEDFKVVPFETSAENLCIWIYNQIVEATGLPLFKIELAETQTSTVIYEPKSI